MAHVQKRIRRRRDRSGKLRPHTQWIARYRDPSGRERSRSFTRETDATAFITSVEGAKQRGDWVDPDLGRIEIASLMRLWLDGVPSVAEAQDGRDLREPDQESDRSYPRRDPHRCSAPDGRPGLDKRDACGWNLAVTHTASPDRAVASVGCRRWGWTHRSKRGPRVKLPRIERREASYLDPATVEMVADAMDEPYDLLVRMLGTVGLDLARPPPSDGCPVQTSFDDGCSCPSRWRKSEASSSSGRRSPMRFDSYPSQRRWLRGLRHGSRLQARIPTLYSSHSPGGRC